MGALLKLVFGFAGGPAAWFATAAGWAMSALNWCLAHWKVVLSALTVLVLFSFGWHEGARREAAKHVKSEANWQARWAKRDEFDRELDLQRKKLVDNRDTVIDTITAERDKARAERGVKYQRIEKEVIRYVENHSKPAAPGSCPTDTDIGDDGVRIIRDAIAARHAGAGEGAGVGSR